MKLIVGRSLVSTISLTTSPIVILHVGTVLIVLIKGGKKK